MLSALDNHKFNFVEILVDEYQDTNPLQGKLLDRFNPRSLFCVGDYDQSIYAFNGSDIGIISSFETRYEDAKIYTLTKNYRSSKPILDLANIVISNNDRIYPKSLEVIRKDISIPPKLLGFEELFDQYKYVAQNISKSDTNHEDIAVIFRNNSSADGIELFLRDLDIPSKRKGGHSFFDLKEVRVVLDIITLLIKPNDMMSFIHIVEYGKGIGKSLAKDIFDALMVLGDKDVLQGLIHPKDILNPYQKKIKVYEVGLFDDDIELGSASRFVKSGFDDNFMGNPILKNTKISIEGGEFLFKLYMLLKLLRRFKNTKAIIEVISQSELFISIKEILSTKRATNKAGEIDSKYKEVIKTNIDKKIVMMQDIAKQYKDVNKFLNAMVLAGGELSTSKGVNLLSIHASKGLEFKEVYIIDLMQNRFPNTKLISKGGSLEEERRLFYVAVTRAKDILYLSYAKYDKIKKQTFLPSRFLKEARMVT
jgi:DNA helicase-2/ATP-dependent DNA helicase PcrA